MVKTLLTLNPEQVTKDDASKLSLREAVRIVAFDSENNIGFLNVTKHGYHKLPGGGIDHGEDRMAALQRECLEEIGCNIAVTGELGIIVEYRPKIGEHQISYCYIGNVVGEKGATELTDEETEKGFEVLWVSLEKAAALLEADNPHDDYIGPFVKERDLTYLRAAKDFLTGNADKVN